MSSISNRKIRSLALLLLLVLTFTAVSAARAVNAVVGTGQAESCNEAALQAAVTAVQPSGTIRFDCGGPATITLSQPLRFGMANAAYILDGGDLITLDGQGTTRLIYIAPRAKSTLTVRNISLINGYASGDLPDDPADDQGGAIFSGAGNTLHIQKTLFADNRAVAGRKNGGGGAVAVSASNTLNVTDSTFTGNSAPGGGAIAAENSRVTIKRSLFQGNWTTAAAPNGGGAIYGTDSRITLTNSHLLDNTSAGYGGGLASFTENPNVKFSGKTTIRGTVLDGNSADKGGGIFKSGVFPLELTGSSITHNTALSSGGGIWGVGTGTTPLKIVNATIAYNAVTGLGYGGGMFTTGGTSVLLNVTVAYNTMLNIASSASAIHGEAKLTNTILFNNGGGWDQRQMCEGTVRGRRSIQYPESNCRGIPVADALLDTALTPARETLRFGQTQLLIPLAGSAAINKGAGCPATDQRSLARPQGARCDIGAVEKEASIPAAPVILLPGANAADLPTQPIFIWESVPDATSYLVTVKEHNGAVLFNAVVAAACAPECSYDSALSGKMLKSGKRYVLTIAAHSEFGRRKAAVSFKTA